MDQDKIRSRINFLKHLDELFYLYREKIGILVFGKNNHASKHDYFVVVGCADKFDKLFQ
jgi:hypothetical protein